MRSDIAISVRNLTKTYRVFGHPTDRIKQALTLGRMRFHREFTALHDISFEIRKGETVGIVGRNGSGKSTLLQLICGILKPTSGKVQANGRISALLELGAGFNPEFTGRENVYFQGALLGLSHEEIDARFADIVAFADIGEFIEQPVRTYSSGMFVRLAFATMIHADADVLIIDEALAVGDEVFQRKCFDKLEEYLNSHNKVLFLVSHNIRQIERVCSRVIWLEEGKVRQLGPASDICSAFQNAVNMEILENWNSHTPQPNIAYSGELDVTGIKLFADGGNEATNEIEAHTPARIKVDFCCHTHLSKPEIVLGYHTGDSVFIAAASTALLPEPLEFTPGEHHIECIFPDMLLLPGVYHIRLGFFDRYRRNVWIGHRLYTFRITPAPASNPMRTPLGLVDMPFEWVA